MGQAVILEPLGHFDIPVLIQNPWQPGQVLRRLNENRFQKRRRRHDDIPTFKKPFAVHLRPAPVTMPDSSIEITLSKIVHCRIGIDAQIDFRVTLQKFTKAWQQPILGEMRRHGDVEDIIVTPELLDITGNCPEIPKQIVGQLCGFRQHDQTIAGTGK